MQTNNNIVSREEEVGDFSDNEFFDDDFEDLDKEVEGTVAYGEGLGLEMAGFQNHVRKMVNGEMEKSHVQ